jgi:hypothetical protein
MKPWLYKWRQPIKEKRERDKSQAAESLVPVVPGPKFMLPLLFLSLDTQLFLEFHELILSLFCLN